MNANSTKLSSRNLETIKTNIASSKECKNECIDLGNNFCPTNSGYTQGTCCNDNSCVGKVDFCSFEAQYLK